MYPFRDIFTIIEKRQICYSKLNAIVESEMSLHAGQVKKLLRGQIIIAKVTLETALCIIRLSIKLCLFPIQWPGVVILLPTLPGLDLFLLLS